ncbi:MAG: hypothetical protein COB67_10635, partial [SAR324 cluster bacterium]
MISLNKEINNFVIILKENEKKLQQIEIENDHIAFRTFDDGRVNIEVLAKPFIAAGYVECGEYHFEKKKLYAKHFEHATDKNAPRVFISQLLTKEFSFELQGAVKNMIDAI